MTKQPLVQECVLFVEIARADFKDFKTQVQAKDPPLYIPANYRVTSIGELDGSKPQTDKNMIVRIAMQFIGQAAT